jgi:hypothetical protein
VSFLAETKLIVPWISKALDSLLSTLYTLQSTSKTGWTYSSRPTTVSCGALVGTANAFS